MSDFLYKEHECCDIWGDPHYTTYDNQVIHYQGVCTYDLSSHRGDFSVHGKNVPTSPGSTVSRLDYMHVYHGGSYVKLPDFPVNMLFI